MKKALSQVARERGVHRSTLTRGIDKYFPAERSGGVWIIDDEDPLFVAWSERKGKGRPRGKSLAPPK